MTNAGGDWAAVARPLSAPAYVITGTGRNVGWRWQRLDTPDPHG